MSDLPSDAAIVRSHNQQAWDALARQRRPHTRPAPNEDFENPLAAVNGNGWLGGSIAGKRVLCLASGGGRQSALYAAAGGSVTVVDVSPEMLALDRQVAAERGLEIRCVQASMDDLSALAAGSFDIVIQPVSTCYVPDVAAVYRQVARVTAARGVYISQHKQPTSLQVAAKPARQGYQVVEPYYRRGSLPAVDTSPHREPGTLEFLHRWEQLLGSLCRAGFVIEDVSEPHLANGDATIGSFAHRSMYVPPYIRIKARRVGASAANGISGTLWMP